MFTDDDHERVHLGGKVVGRNKFRFELAANSGWFAHDGGLVATIRVQVQPRWEGVPPGH